MLEKAYNFGNNRHLLGILTEPDTRITKRASVGVLLLNAGLLHHVGPYRLHVDLARKLASCGFPVLRFDLSGIGDSVAQRDYRTSEDAAVEDIQEAMNFLNKKTRTCRFVLIGLCSGAENAHKMAVLDSRVTGAVFLDGYTYPTWRYYLRYYGPRLLNLKKWQGLLRRNYARLLAAIRIRSHQFDTQDVQDMWQLPLPPKDKTRTELVGLIERGVNLFYIYSGGARNNYNYRDQFRDMFKSVDFQDKLQVKFFEEADHTYTLLEDRARLMTSICDWVQINYKSSAVPQTSSGNESVNSQE